MKRKIDDAHTQYVRQVKKLIALIANTDANTPSVTTYAKRYFTLIPPMKKYANDLSHQIDHIRTSGLGQRSLPPLQQKWQENQQKLLNEHEFRHSLLRNAIALTVTLSEGDSDEETQINSAKMLGCLLLLTQGNEGNYRHFHQQLKPIYKAVLVLRLIDKVLAESSIENPYLSQRKALLHRYDDENLRQRWYDEIACPVISAAIVQDIGLVHPEALLLLKGINGTKDPYRTLEDTERKALLKLNYQSTLTYVKDALCFAPDLTAYPREPNAVVDDTHQFAIDIIQEAFTGKSGIGDLLKIPQVYASVVLSTKPDYDRLSLPKGYMIIEQMAKHGGINARLANHFIRIVGYFPQGFGICFIPVNDKGFEKDQYEYAIVTRLNPNDPATPVCRVVSRNLSFTGHGKEESINKSRNLYFKAARQKLMKLDRQRHAEILRQMTKNFKDSDLDKQIPSFWEPYDFFSEKRNQSLWK
ncbi:hypothetical protein [Alteromonas sp. C1M14]|uniref:hypothetical protein n=1 Tax=Alteromonas sp. C1M14 TaxID=2841567 RepID=UPI001C09BC78|nr:hypothetical protein [Alteromonas sp. C1M14]MBU2979758.1 hypothetical protein [Alteromonas sp. C1M14]